MKILFLFLSLSIFITNVFSHNDSFTHIHNDNTAQVDAIISYGKTLEEAENKAKKLALNEALMLRGNQEISDDIRLGLFANVSKYVVLTDQDGILQNDDGFFYPVYSAKILLTDVDNFINKEYHKAFKQFPPIVAFGISVIDEDNNKQFVTRLVNTKIKNFFEKKNFTAVGFNIKNKTNSSLKSLKTSMLEDRNHDATYLIYGIIKLNNKNQKTGYRFSADIGIKTHSLLGGGFILVEDDSKTEKDNEIVLFSTADGSLKDNKIDAINSAVNNAINVITNKLLINRMREQWSDGLKNGFKHHFNLCSTQKTYDKLPKNWKTDFVNSLKETGDIKKIISPPKDDSKDYIVLSKPNKPDIVPLFQEIITFDSTLRGKVSATSRLIDEKFSIVVGDLSMNDDKEFICFSSGKYESVTDSL
jgi:hypothetical protein